MDFHNPEQNTEENKALMEEYRLDSTAVTQSKWLSESRELKAWRIKGKPGLISISSPSTVP